MKGSIAIVLLEKCATVKSASYYQFLWQNSQYLLNDPHTLVTTLKSAIRTSFLL